MFKFGNISEIVKKNLFFFYIWGSALFYLYFNLNANKMLFRTIIVIVGLHTSKLIVINY